MGRTLLATKRILDVGGYCEPDILDSLDVIPPFFMKALDERPEHTNACIACSTASQSYDDVLGPFADSISHQLPCAVARRYHRIALLLCQQGQTTGLGYLYHGQIDV